VRQVEGGIIITNVVAVRGREQGLLHMGKSLLKESRTGIASECLIIQIGIEGSVQLRDN